MAVNRIPDHTYRRGLGPHRTKAGPTPKARSDLIEPAVADLLGELLIDSE
jgi:hypothetical protein